MQGGIFCCQSAKFEAIKWRKKHLEIQRKFIKNHTVFGKNPLDSSVFLGANMREKSVLHIVYL